MRISPMRVLCALVVVIPAYTGAQGCTALPSGGMVQPVRYDRADNVVHFYVTPFGNVIHRPNAPVDENDDVVIHVLTTPDVAKQLKVVRKSAFRSVGTISIVGGEVKASELTAAVVKSLSEGPTCDYVVRLSDFAPGRAVVGISLFTLEANALKEIALGEFDFGVRPLYSGAFSFGPGYSRVVDRSYALVSKEGGQVVSESDGGDFRILYALSYTHYIWGRRDIEKPVQGWEMFNPFVAVVPNKLNDNAVVGVSVDLPMAIFVQVGEHFGRVTRLDPSSGLVPNGPATGVTGSVPTVKRWRAKPVYSVSVDLRAMLQLLRTAATSSLGG